MTWIETPSTAPEKTPSVPVELNAKVNRFLETLKTEVEQQSDPEQRKRMVAERVRNLNAQELAELSSRVEDERGSISHELLEALIGVLEFSEERRAELRTQIEARKDTEKPEGLFGRMGEGIKGGVETVTGWIKKGFGWTGDKVGKGWGGFVAGITTAVTALTKGWNWVREKSAQALGPIVARIKLPEPTGTFGWLRRVVDFLIGEYGAAYRGLTESGIEVVPDASGQAPSLRSFLDRYNQNGLSARAVSIDQYCQLVAAALRADASKAAAYPFRVTQAELEKAADAVVAKQMTITPPPATPTAAPAVPSVPAAAPTAVPPSTSPTPTSFPVPAPAAPAPTAPAPPASATPS